MMMIKLYFQEIVTKLTPKSGEIQIKKKKVIPLSHRSTQVSVPNPLLKSAHPCLKLKRSSIDIPALRLSVSFPIRETRRVDWYRTRRPS